MAVLYSLARVRTPTTGTGTITLGAAVPGFLTFALAGAQNGDDIAYSIRDGVHSEIGHGTYTSATLTLTRTVRKSTNGDAAISLSGNAEVVISPAAEDIIASAAVLLAALLTVDGPGSLLNADFLDGLSSADFALAADLAAHLADTTAAHAASAISVSPSGSLAATDAQTALLEILGDIETHVADATAAHAAAAISYNGGTGMSATDVEAAIDELATEKQDAATAITQGLHSIWVPALAMVSRTTNGAAIGTVEMATNKNMFKTLDFDTTTQEFAQFAIRMPTSWNEGTVTFAPVWSHTGGANFGVAFGLAGVAISNDDAGDVAFGTAQTSVDTGGTTNDIYEGPTSSAITIAGTPAAGDYVMFQINRTVADAGDTLTVDARLHGVTVFYTINAATDA